MDESDASLAEALRRELVGSGRRTAFGPGNANPKDDEGGAFLAALEAFRAAKRSGDTARTAAAEHALQDVVRAEMARDEGCDL